MRKAGQEAGKGQARLANANFSLGFAFGDGCAQGWQTSNKFGLRKANVFFLHLVKAEIVAKYVAWNNVEAKTMEKHMVLHRFEAKTVEKHVVLNHFEAKNVEKHVVLNHFEAKNVEKHVVLNHFEAKNVEKTRGFEPL